jgi:hypothetical protein
MLECQRRQRRVRKEITACLATRAGLGQDIEVPTPGLHGNVLWLGAYCCDESEGVVERGRHGKDPSIRGQPQERPPHQPRDAEVFASGDQLTEPARGYRIVRMVLAVRSEHDVDIQQFHTGRSSRYSASARLVDTRNRAGTTPEYRQVNPVPQLRFLQFAPNRILDQLAECLTASVRLLLGGEQELIIDRDGGAHDVIIPASRSSHVAAKVNRAVPIQRAKVVRALVS